VESAVAELLLRALHLADFNGAHVAQLLASRLTQVPGDAITAQRALYIWPWINAEASRGGRRRGRRRFGETYYKRTFAPPAPPHTWVWAGGDKLQCTVCMGAQSAWVHSLHVCMGAGPGDSWPPLQPRAACGRLWPHLQMVVPELGWFESGLEHLGTFATSRELTKAGMPTRGRLTCRMHGGCQAS
jgi:hypothetical protein